MSLQGPFDVWTDVKEISKQIQVQNYHVRNWELSWSDHRWSIHHQLQNHFRKTCVLFWKELRANDLARLNESGNFSKNKRKISDIIQSFPIVRSIHRDCIFSGRDFLCSDTSDKKFVHLSHHCYLMKFFQLSIMVSIAQQTFLKDRRKWCRTKIMKTDFARESFWFVSSSILTIRWSFTYKPHVYKKRTYYQFNSCVHICQTREKRLKIVDINH